MYINIFVCTITERNLITYPVFGKLGIIDGKHLLELITEVPYDINYTYNFETVNYLCSLSK